MVRIGGYCTEIGGQEDPWTQVARTNLRDRYEPDSQIGAVSQT